MLVELVKRGTGIVLDSTCLLLYCSNQQHQHAWPKQYITIRHNNREGGDTLQSSDWSSDDSDISLDNRDLSTKDSEPPKGGLSEFDALEESLEVENVGRVKQSSARQKVKQKRKAEEETNGNNGREVDGDEMDDGRKEERDSRRSLYNQGWRKKRRSRVEGEIF